MFAENPVLHVMHDVSSWIWLGIFHSGSLAYPGESFRGSKPCLANPPSTCPYKEDVPMKGKTCPWRGRCANEGEDVPMKGKMCPWRCGNSRFKKLKTIRAFAKAFRESKLPAKVRVSTLPQKMAPAQACAQVVLQCIGPLPPKKTRLMSCAASDQQRARMRKPRIARRRSALLCMALAMSLLSRTYDMSVSTLHLFLNAGSFCHGSSWITFFALMDGYLSSIRMYTVNAFIELLDSQCLIMFGTMLL